MSRTTNPAPAPAESAPESAPADAAGFVWESAPEVLPMAAFKVKGSLVLFITDADGVPAQKVATLKGPGDEAPMILSAQKVAAPLLARIAELEADAAPAA